MNPVVLAVTFGTIFVVELPDKTFLATLVLATRYRPILVWLGVAAAFAVQTTVAVALGQVATLLPPEVVRSAALVLFLVGATLLIREARSRPGPDDGVEETAPARGWRAVTASFLVLFAAEWGDLSQLLTLSLVARYDDPLSVFLGALAALLTVSGLAVLVGRTLLRYIALRRLHYAGAAVCLGLAALTLVELVG